MTTIEDRLRGLFETMNEGVVLHEVVYDEGGEAIDYRIHDVNPAFERQVGIPRSVAVNALASQLYGAGEAPYLEVYAKVAETLQPTSFQTYFPPLDQHFEISVFAPKKGWFATVFLDITPLVKAREELRHERDRLTAVMEASPIGILHMDLKRRAMFTNPRADELLRLVPHPEEPRRVLPPEAQMLDEDGSVVPEAQQPNHQALLTGEPVYQRHLELRLPEESPRHLSISAVPMKDAEGDVHGVISTVEDISTAVEAEREHRHLTEQLERMRKLESIGRLAGGIAHDFNNMLTPILGYTEMARMLVDDDSPVARNLDKVMHASQRARDMIGQFLAFGRKQVLEVQVCSLNTLVAEYENVLRRLVREDIDLRLELTPSLWACRVDASQIEQILLNLASNAVDAMDGPGVLTIETQNVRLDQAYADQHPGVEPGEYVMLAVSDTGVGMDEATQSHIFEPFFTTKEDSGGTGLGLATVWGLVRQHGGHVWVYSEQGVGTTFKVYLQRVDEEAVERKVARSRSSSREGRELVLLVEDDRDVRELAHTILTQRGYQVLVASNSDEALAEAAGSATPIDLLLTDVIVPRMNGREIHRRVRNIHEAVRVLYMSGYTDNVIAHQGVLEPGIHFLQKPFTAQDLLAKVEEVLEG